MAETRPEAKEKLRLISMTSEISRSRETFRHSVAGGEREMLR